VSTPILGLAPHLWICLAVLGGGLAALSWIDLRTGFLPLAIQIPLGLAGGAATLLWNPAGIGWRLALAGAAINAGVFAGLRWAVSRWKGREAMGEGDIWLVGVGGLWVGPWALPYIMAIAGLGTLVGAGIAGAALRRPVWRGEMPLGPGLAFGIFVCFLAGVLRPSWLPLGGF
jgi:leader peptidase (prepilin peptidase)/N-methyltransferase